MDAVGIGKRIKSLRIKRGMSQNQLAKSARVSQAGLSAIESGSASPSVQTVAMIAEVLGVSASFLMGESSETNTGSLTGSEFAVLERAKSELDPEKWKAFLKLVEDFTPKD